MTAGGMRSSEVKTLRLVADGWLNTEIAAHLGISEQAVKNRLSQAAQKLGNPHNRLGLALLAHHAGLVDLDASAQRYAERMAA